MEKTRQVLAPRLLLLCANRLRLTSA